MAVVQVIIHGMGGSIYDTAGDPVVLRFYDDRLYETAEWLVPTFPGIIPTELLSEIRVMEGPLSVIVEGPSGFKSGPYEATWVRSNYPSGKACAFLVSDPAGGSMTGVSLAVDGESLVVEPMTLGNRPGTPTTGPAEAPAQPE